MEKILNIYHFNNQKKFTEDESYQMVNLFMAITSKAKNKINGLSSKLEFYKNQPDMADIIQTELNIEIQKWSEKVRRLGATPLGLYKVSIPASDGNFNWVYPSADIEFTSI